MRCRSTTGGGNPRESATESRPPSRQDFGPGLTARVKGCGKSAPRPRQRGRHGKPHREQGRIGAAGGVTRKRDGRGGIPAPPPGLAARSGWRHPLQRNGRPVPVRRGGQNPAYRPPGATCFPHPIHGVVPRPLYHVTQSTVARSTRAWEQDGALGVRFPHRCPQFDPQTAANHSQPPRRAFDTVKKRVRFARSLRITRG